MAVLFFITTFCNKKVKKEKNIPMQTKVWRWNIPC